jgi:ABC-type enterochelin transport system ATPase subunit
MAVQQVTQTVVIVDRNANQASAYFEKLFEMNNVHIRRPF